MSHQFINQFNPIAIATVPNGSNNRSKKGRVVVLDNLSNNPVSLFKLNQSSPYDYLEPLVEFRFDTFEVDAITALTHDSQYLYAITSHSRNRKGKVKSKRNRIIRFGVNKSQLIKPLVLENLRDWMVYAYPQLRKASKVKKKAEEEGLYIQGLAYDEDDNQLLIGLGNPLDEQKHTLLIPLNLKDNIFKNKLLNSRPQPLLHIDLEQHILVDLSYVSQLNGFLILTQAPKSAGYSITSNQFWFWNKNHSPKKIRIKGHQHLANMSGFGAIQLQNGDEGIFICQSSENQKHQIPANYQFIPFKRLKY